MKPTSNFQEPQITDSPFRARCVASLFRVIGRIYPFGNNRYCAYILSRFGAQVAGAALCTLQLPGGGKFSFPLNDKYWIKLLMPAFRYEPEVDFLIGYVAEQFRGSLLIDCGANFGYWVSRSKAYLGLQVVAIEPSPTALKYLRFNIAANQEHATLYERAVWKANDEELQFASSCKIHAGSALASVARHNTDEGDWSMTSVKTVSIDAIVNRHRLPSHEIVIIKLDVEGAEVDAIEGGLETLRKGEAVLIYEDHADDSHHEITKYLMDCGMLVFSFRESRLARINSLDQMTTLKSHSGTHYNFNNFAACLPGSKSEAVLHGAMAK